ncbi:MAG: phosphonopyruvate decarboxylase [Thiotrichaceae bacterium]|nr:phosphonopyruvate decarboxylase [Thiotrichaceae bacterium]
MIKCNEFVSEIKEHFGNFFTGSPDSLLKDLCAYLEDSCLAGEHMVAVNEGNAIGLAAGYHLATGKIPVVYMQNSGLGNTVNPLMSLTDSKVYQIPILMVIGWRGEPGIKDEPQHVKQGEVTLPLLETMGIAYEVVSGESENVKEVLQRLATRANETSAPVALVVKKGTFEKYKLQKVIADDSGFEREDAIGQCAKLIGGEAVVLSTTGKISRELYEYRVGAGEKTSDFLNVGSMGHVSQVALGVALNRPSKKVYVFDCDGAMLMHMGGMATIGNSGAKNLIHIVFNNRVHDSVGGQPTVAANINMQEIALACGYRVARKVKSSLELSKAVEELNGLEGPILLEVVVKKGARADLGRPKSTPVENKLMFMESLNG